MNSSPNPIKVCNNCERVYQVEDDLFDRTSRWRLCEMGHLWFNCSCHSTLMVPQSKCSFYTPKRHMSSQAKSLFMTLEGLSDLPRVPSAIMRLQQAIEHPKASAQALAGILKRDPSFAAEVLQLARSIQARRAPKQPAIGELSHAIAYLGLDTLKDMVHMLSMRSFQLKTKTFTHAVFWQEAYLTGAYAEALAESFASEYSRDELYLAGCLSNIGKLLSAYLWPQRTDKIYNLANNRDSVAPWTTLETQVGAKSHTILGEIACCLWGLPESVMIAARFHHTPFQPEIQTSLPALIHFAQQLTHWQLLQPSRMNERLFNETKERFKLDDSTIEHMIQMQSIISRESSEA